MQQGWSRSGFVCAFVLALMVFLVPARAEQNGPIFIFLNGTKVYKANPNSANKSGLFVQVGGSKLQTIVQKVEVSMVRYMKSNDKIALAHTQHGDFYAISSSGSAKQLGTLDKSRLKSDFSHHTTRISWAGKQYWIVNFRGRDPEDKGQVYIINEGAEILKYPKPIDLRPGAEPRIQSGVLMLNEDTLVDLGAFKVLEPMHKTFSNGARLSLETGFELRVRYESPTLSKGITEGEAVYWNPLTVDAVSSLNRRENVPLNVDLLVMQTGARIVTADGTVTEIPLDSKTALVSNSGTILRPLQTAFVSDNKHFMLVSFGTPPAKEENAVIGETYLIDEVGNVVMVDRKRHTKFDYTIEDGILTLKGSARGEIDLRCMEGEAFFTPQHAKGTIKEGDAVANVHTFVDQHFGNFASKVSSAPKDVYEFDTARAMELQAALLMDGGSVVITSPAGSGKTQVMKDFVSAVKAGQLPGFPRTTRFLELRPTQINQGAKYTGILDSRVEALIEYAKIRPTILMGDELHSLRGIGTHSGNQNDIFEYLKPPIGEGSVRMFAATTDHEFDEAFGGDQALLRRVLRVKWPVPDAKKAASMAAAWMANHGYALHAEELAEFAVEVSNRMDAIGAQPAKAIKLLRYAFGYKRSYGDFGKTLHRGDIELAAQAMYKLDVDTFSPDRMKVRIDQLMAYLDQKIAGQQPIKSSLEELTRQKVYGLTDPNRIAMSMLFAGPPGSGKTTLAKSFAEGMGFQFRKIDMTGYTDYEAPQRFKSLLASIVTENPYSVILLDELEKCSQVVQNELLTIMTDGEFETYRALGSTSRKTVPVMVNARNIYLLATTNAGTPEVERGGVGFGFSGGLSTSHMASEGRLRGAVSGEGILGALVDRFDEVSAAPSSNEEQVPQVLEIQIGRFLKVLTDGPFKGVELDFKNREEFIAYAADLLRQEPGSNRDISRLLTSTLSRAFSRWLSAKKNGEPLPSKLEIRYDASEKNSFSIGCPEELVELAA